MTNSRISEAVNRKKSGKYNCCQAVATTYATLTPLTEEQVMAVGSPFGMGMGCMEGTCGAIVGAGIILGLIHPDRAKSMPLMKKVILDFKARNGATQCRKLKGIDTGKPIRDCNDCVADAAEFLEKILDNY